MIVTVQDSDELIGGLIQFIVVEGGRNVHFEEEERAHMWCLVWEGSMERVDDGLAAHKWIPFMISREIHKDTPNV